MNKRRDEKEGENSKNKIRRNNSNQLYVYNPPLNGNADYGPDQIHS